MNIEKYKCDTCGKEVADRYSEHGWIRLDHPTIYIYHGRRKDLCKSAITSYKEIPNGKQIDFCGFECFLKYFERLSDEGIDRRDVGSL